MISVSLKICDKKRYLRLKVKGHAKQADIGQDIVCASASILTYTVAQIVTDMKKKELLETEPTVILDSGNATVTCICKTESAYAEAFSAFYVAMVGYQLLAHNYPQFVELNIVGEVE